jgi:hypothetical protein
MALLLEPVEHIGVKAQGDRLLDGFVKSRDLIGKAPRTFRVRGGGSQAGNLPAGGRLAGSSATLRNSSASFHLQIYGYICTYHFASTKCSPWNILAIPAPISTPGTTTMSFMFKSKGKFLDSG